MAFIGKLMGNLANRLDPKYIVVFGNREDTQHLNMQSIRFKKLDDLNIKYEKFNSVMMVKHVTRELKEQQIKHYTIERW